MTSQGRFDYPLPMPAKLYTPVKLPGARNLGLRVLFVLGLLAAVVVVIYFEKGHRDSRTGEAPDFLSCIYFAFVTVTTVGYGDIVPVTQTARLVDALFLTPIRFIVILIFVGTAYQLALKRLQEEYRMKRVVSKLTGHIVVCGFGTTGRAVVQELLLQGEIARQIVVIDEDEKRLAAATQLGVIGVLGDASQETVLKSVAIERAEHVIICP
ncbi:MAG: NAD-binding protein, partial [Candidatus Hydrogenedentes bacterium]|nr:NAD-binding protein [Candidatus Hydrogenedentota bacterium]